MGILLALLAAFFAFTWRITLRTKIKPGKSDIAFTALVDLFAALTLFLFIPLFDIKLPSGTELLWIFLLSILFSAIGDYLLVFATKNADTADTSILMPLSSIWVLILSSIFLNEAMDSWKIIGVILIVIGSIITLYKKEKFVINKGIIAALLYGLLITGTILIDKGISANFSLPIYGSIFYFLSSAFLMIFSGRNSFKKVKKEWEINRWWTLIIGVQWALFTLTLLLAYSHTEASKAIPLTRMFIVLVTVYSIFVMREKDRMWQKIVGSIIVTGGALILAYLE